MTFTSAARKARRGITRAERTRVLFDKGWVEPLAPPRILQEVGIEYEVVGDPRGAVWTRGGKGIYAPVWVYGVVDRAKTTSWYSASILLRATRDDARDQKLLCGELIMDSSLPVHVRAAATNFLRLRSEDEKDRKKGLPSGAAAP